VICCEIRRLPRVVLPARFCEHGGYNEIHEFCRDLETCSIDGALLAKAGYRADDLK
jgi:hypothetical protein